MSLAPETGWIMKANSPIGMTTLFVGQELASCPRFPKRRVVEEARGGEAADPYGGRS
jgi:hypothetical protein